MAVPNVDYHADIDDLGKEKDNSDPVIPSLEVLATPVKVTLFVQQVTH